MKAQAILLASVLLFSTSFPAIADNAPAQQHDAASAVQANIEKVPSQKATPGSSGQKTGESAPVHPMPGWGAGLLVIFSNLLVLFGVLHVTSRLKLAPTSKTPDGKDWTWSLAQALSEEVEFTTTDAAGAKTSETIMIASTSRLVALFGLIALLVLFMGFGSVAMWYFATTSTMPDFGNILNFFYAGAGLFVPYGLNQFKAAFESFSPK
jgi:hypothetical protein